MQLDPVFCTKWNLISISQCLSTTSGIRDSSLKIHSFSYHLLTCKNQTLDLGHQARIHPWFSISTNHNQPPHIGVSLTQSFSSKQGHHGESCQWVGHVRRVLDPTNKWAQPVAYILELHLLLQRCPVGVGHEKGKLVESDETYDVYVN